MSRSSDPVRAWGQQFQNELKEFFDSLSPAQKTFCAQYHQYEILSKIAEQSVIISGEATNLGPSTTAKTEIKRLTSEFAQHSFSGNSLPFKDSAAEDISTALINLYHQHLLRFDTLPSKYSGIFGTPARIALKLEIPVVEKSRVELATRLNSPPIEIKQSEVKNETKTSGRNLVQVREKIDRLRAINVAITTTQNQLLEHRKWYHQHMLWAGLRISKPLRLKLQSLEREAGQLKDEINKIHELIQTNRINSQQNGQAIDESGKMKLVDQVIAVVRPDFNAVGKGSQQKLRTLLLSVLEKKQLQNEMSNPKNHPAIVNVLASKVKGAFYKKSFSFWGLPKEIYFKNSESFKGFEPVGRALGEQMLVDGIKVAIQAIDQTFQISARY